MTKRDLIRGVHEYVKGYPLKDIAHAVQIVFDAISQSLLKGERVDIRGFGNFTVRHRTTKTGRNPKTSEAIYLSERRMPMFKAGKDISAKINKSY